MNKATTRIFLLVVTVALWEAANAQGAKQQSGSKEKLIVLTGKVINEETKEPIPDLSVTDVETKNSELTDANGKFIMRVRRKAKLLIIGDNIQPKVYSVGASTNITIKVKAAVSTSTTPEVLYNGYQQFSKTRNTNSNFCISEEAFQQRTSRDVVTRFEGLVPGLLPVTNKNDVLNQPAFFSIGGRSTLIASPDPLTIVDGFPYVGSMSNLNPDDIESISVLRDAAGIGIWGTRASNGVIVIKTKSAKYIPRLRISFNNNWGFTGKPDVFSQDRMNADQRIYADSVWFANGYFFPLLRSRAKIEISPIVEALDNNNLTDEGKRAYLDSLRKIDNRDELMRMFYRSGFMLHNSLQLAGGSDLYNFYFSLGYDHTQPEVRQSLEDRKTFLLNVNAKHPASGFEFSAAASAADNSHHNVDGVPELMRPYELLVDKGGCELPVPYKRRFKYVDTLSDNNLLDWKYYPLNEFNLRNRTLKEVDLRYQIGVKFKKFPRVFNGLEAGFLLQKQYASSERAEIHAKESFFARDLINSFSQATASGLERPIPVGGIADFTKSNFSTFNMRFALTYARKVGQIGRDSLIVMAGNDRNITTGDLSSERIYGYSDDNKAGQSGMDYTSLYPMYYFTSLKERIPQLNSQKSVFQNYFSSYLSTMFFWKERYEFSANARYDKSNLFGALIKNKRVPLASLGVAWYLSSEPFYSSKWLPLVKIRANYGGSGNSPKKAIPIQTIGYSGVNANGDPIASFTTPPLPSLRWEKMNTLNLGMNLRSANDRIELSFDWYRKSSKELIGYRQLNSTSGNYFLTSNIASMESGGAELVLETININREFRWRTSFISSFIKDYVKKIEDTLRPAWEYCDPGHFNSVSGKPLYSVFSFAYKGLNEKGDPVGEKGTNYIDMLTMPGTSGLIYHGRGTPAFFGSITNDFSYKQFNLSVTLLYKLKYYFRKQSINYYNLYSGVSQGSPDFKNRWQQAGDELRTNVPAMPITTAPDLNRDLFYNYSQVLVARADHIRFQNIHLSYFLQRKALKKLGLLTANIYINCSNWGIIWKANNWGIDPDKLTGYPQPKQYTIGFRGTFK